MSDLNMLTGAHITVTGGVQGIGYRYFVKRLSDKSGIKGYVRNKSDGSVELDIECDDSILSGFIKKLKSEHPWARVENIHTANLPYKGIYSAFEII